MKIVYAARAKLDLAEIVDLLRARNEHAALVVAAAIRRRIALLGRYPFSGRAQDVAGVGKAFTVPFGYLIFHDVDEASRTVTILTIRHPARDRPFADA